MLIPPDDVMVIGILAYRVCVCGKVETAMLWCTAAGKQVSSGVFGNALLRGKQLLIGGCMCVCSAAAYKYGDGKKIDGKRVVVDVERGRTVKSWKPRRLGEYS